MDRILTDLIPSLNEQTSLDAQQQTLLHFKTAVAQAVGGQAYYRRSSNIDVLARGSQGEPSLGIKIALWNRDSLSRNLASRIGDLTAQASNMRDPEGGRCFAALIVVVPGDPEPDLSTIGTHLAGIGYDRVVVGEAGNDGGWWVVNHTGALRPVSDLGVAVARHSLPPPAPKVPPRMRFLLVADEWNSGTGGISTLNRELAIALADADVEVRVVVPTANADDRAAATKQNVQLVAPDPIPGITGNALLVTPPRFDDEYQPDVIVGHGRILGPYAYAIQHHYFPTAKRLHIVHMDPDRLELAKEEPEGRSRMLTSDERREMEAKLAESADLVAGVGPHLAKSVRHWMRGRESPAPSVFSLVPGLRDWGAVVDPDEPPERRQVLLMARAEDVHSKGLDLAVRMVKEAMRDKEVGDSMDERPALVIRGVRPDDADGLKKRLENLAGPGLEIFLRPYSSNEAHLRSDLWGSRVVIMPSLHEGFGLAAYEAIAAGVPVLITADSGLAQLLIDHTTDAERKGPREVLPVRAETEEEVVTAWARALSDRLTDPVAAFKRAADLRLQILDRFTWQNAAADLLKRLGQGRPAGRETPRRRREDRVKT